MLEEKRRVSNRIQLEVGEGTYSTRVASPTRCVNTATAASGLIYTRVHSEGVNLDCLEEAVDKSRTTIV